MSVKPWIMLVRGPFLLLSLVLTLYGIAIAFHLSDGKVNWFYSILAGIGLVCMHISVNVFNEFFDFKTGIDLETAKTPFSGGSGILPSGDLSSMQALLLAIFSLIVGASLGAFLAVTTGWELWIIGLIGVFLVVGYTTVLAKYGVGELAAGLGLGTLPVLGVQFVSTSQISVPALIAAIPAGFLVFNLLFLNEFPDMEADKKGGRKHLVICFGKKTAGWIYTLFAMAVFLWIVGAVLLDVMPIYALLGLLAFPLGLRASIGALRDFDSFEKFIPAQAMNVGVTLLTQVLLAIGYFLSPSSS